MPVTASILRGTLPDFVVKKLRSDRYGVLSGSVERTHKVGPKNQRIDPQWVSLAFAPNPGWGIPCVEIDGDIRDSLFVARFSYEGLDPDRPNDAAEEQKTFELDGTMGDRRIELHPRFDELKSKFGWDEENRAFGENLPGNVTGTRALQFSGKKGERSPLAGLDSWFYVGLTYRITYATRTLPDDLLGKIGTLIKNPPNIQKFKIPAASKNRRWLVMAPKVSLRGDAAQVSEEYLLGEPGGLPEAIYGASQLG